MKIRMPRFYFDVRSRSAWYQDCDGLEVADKAAAHAEALNLARRLWGEMLFRSEDPLSAVVAIKDENGGHAWTVPFAEVQELLRKEAQQASDPETGQS